MLAPAKPGADFSMGRAHLHTQTTDRHSYDPPPTKENRSPGNGTPARRGARTALPWMVLGLGGRGKLLPALCQSTAHKPPTHHARRRRRALKASQAGALLV